MYLLNRQCQQISPGGRIAFTFHYVSIKSAHNTSDDSIVARFTFHYVSIKSISHRLHLPQHYYLHSTMYLLNLFRKRLTGYIIMYLHSTMYLLNLCLR